MTRPITIAVLLIPFLLPACRTKSAEPQKTAVQPSEQEKAAGQPAQPTEPNRQVEADALPDIAPRLKVPWKGDLDEIAKRRLVRVLLPFRRPEFFYMDFSP